MHFRLSTGLVCVGLVWFVFFAPSNNTVIKLLAGVLDRIHSILFLCLFWQFKSCFCSMVLFCNTSKYLFICLLLSFHFLFHELFVHITFFLFFSQIFVGIIWTLEILTPCLLQILQIFPPAYKWSQFFLMLFSNKEIFINM